MIKLIIIDDSALVRKAISYCFEGDPEVRIVGVYPSPVEVIKEISTIKPDVIICDIEMPGMNGLEFLRVCSENRWRIPVIICSAQVDKVALAMQAYSLGAVEVLLKPDMSIPKSREESKGVFRQIVRLAYQSRGSLKFPSSPVEVARAPMAQKAQVAGEGPIKQLILVGSSTGGPDALKVFLASLPAQMPPILIVQHMPQGFTKLFADSLDKLCALHVTEAKMGDIVANNHVYIAPGNKQMSLKKVEGKYQIHIEESPLVNGHRPSVDVLFWSGARLNPSQTVGVILTGMGNDGANGMKVLKEAGVPLTIAQDEASCVVFGMPKEAIALRCVDSILPLTKIGSSLVQNLKMRGAL